MGVRLFGRSNNAEHSGMTKLVRFSYRAKIRRRRAGVVGVLLIWVLDTTVDAEDLA